MVVNGDDDSISLSLSTLFTGIESSTIGKGYKGQQDGLKLVILIEKCTHVKGRKSVLLRKIKWRQMMSQWNQCTSRKQYVHPKTDEGKLDMDHVHIGHKISVDYSTEFSHEWPRSGIHHQSLDKLRLRPDTSVITEFVCISSVKTRPCVQSLLDWPPTAGAALSFTGKDLSDVLLLLYIKSVPIQPS